MSTDAGGSWTVMNSGLPNVAVFDLAYNPSTGVLLAATHGRGMWALSLDRPLTVSVAPVSRSTSALIGSPESHRDSATVILTGTSSATAQWSATHGGSSWLNLEATTGTGTARLRWTRDASTPTAGTLVDTIRVTVPGAVDSPFELVDTFVVQAPRTMTVEPSSRSHTAAVGSTSPVMEEATISFTGLDADRARWEVTHGDAPWLAVTTPSWQGSGTIRWTRDPTGLAEGVYVDTILVSSVGALGTPAAIVDSLIMEVVPVGLDPAKRSGQTVAGTVEGVPDSARVLLSGAGAETAQWTATSTGTSWLVFTTSGGTGPGMVRWVRDPAGLKLGSYTDTITVQSPLGGPARLIDSFTLTAPFLPLGCPVNHLLGTPCLSDIQLRFLDLEGNADGTYNLGDFLAELAREKAGTSPEGGR
jgi:hypothetical protein